MRTRFQTMQRQGLLEEVKLFGRGGLRGLASLRSGDTRRQWSFLDGELSERIGWSEGDFDLATCQAAEDLVSKRPEIRLVSRAPESNRLWIF